MIDDKLYELACSRCGYLFWVTEAWNGDEWLCEDCTQHLEERATEHLTALWHGGNGPQSDRERDEVRR